MKEKTSYLGMVEYGDKIHRQFFTSVNPETARKEADEYNASVLREHGTSGVRCTLSKVEFCITG